MKAQLLPGGRTYVDYGDPVPYQSALRVSHDSAHVLTYYCSKTDRVIGQVYKVLDGGWWVTSPYFKKRHTLPAITKLGGFLMLNDLYRSIYG